MTRASTETGSLQYTRLDYDGIRRRFVEKGYVVLHDLLSPDQVESLRKECTRRLAWEPSLQSLVRKSGCILESVPGAPSACKRDANLYGDIRHKRGLDSSVTQLIVQDIPLLVEKLLGAESGSIHLLNEQYIVKPPNSGGKTAFGWHQDAETMPVALRHAPYVSVWCALDEMNEEVGTLCVPNTQQKAEIFDTYEVGTSLVAKKKAGESNGVTWDWAGGVMSQVWAGAERPEECEESDGENEHALMMDAGSVVVLHPLFWHKSCPNISDRMRRAYMPQYSVGGMVGGDGEPVVLAVPCRRE